MNKDDILKKSREENKNRDPYEAEVIREGGNYGAAAAAVLATIFVAVQIFVGGGMNLGLYAVAFVSQAVIFTVKAVKLRRRHEIVLAVLAWVTVALFSGMHIYQLVTTSAIL